MFRILRPVPIVDVGARRRVYAEYVARHRELTDIAVGCHNDMIILAADGDVQAAVLIARGAPGKRVEFPRHLHGAGELQTCLAGHYGEYLVGGERPDDLFEGGLTLAEFQALHPGVVEVLPPDEHGTPVRLGPGATWSLAAGSSHKPCGWIGPDGLLLAQIYWPGANTLQEPIAPLHCAAPPRHRDIMVLARGGDALTAPSHTLTAMWAALAGGAAGIAVELRLTADATLVCADTATLPAGPIAALKLGAVLKFDAGAGFRSTELGPDLQPTGAHGGDRPWVARKSNAALTFPTLREVLTTFGRRAELLLRVPDDEGEGRALVIARAAIAALRALGLLARATLVVAPGLAATLAAEAPELRLALVATGPAAIAGAAAVAREVGATRLYLDIESLCDPTTAALRPESDATGELELLVASEALRYAPRPAVYAALQRLPGLRALVARGVLPTVALASPPALVHADRFLGKRIDTALWSAGYSHANQDTRVEQNDGFHVRIEAGGAYSGGAIVTVPAIHGRFDAQVEFQVDHPQQATTFEMAAIGIDAGYHHPDNTDLNSTAVNLTFDVHGAPPYASSERDEDDGFRCGWNNGYNLTKVDADFTAASVNMYNKYGRDVGNGRADSPVGELRLVRNGAVFATYYTDAANRAWVCSGAMLVPNLGPDVHIRLAAKHWKKTQPQPPGNHVVFRNFRLYQF